MKHSTTSNGEVGTRRLPTSVSRPPLHPSDAILGADAKDRQQDKLETTRAMEYGDEVRNPDCNNGMILLAASSSTKTPERTRGSYRMVASTSAANSTETKVIDAVSGHSGTELSNAGGSSRAQLKDKFCALCESGRICIRFASPE